MLIKRKIFRLSIIACTVLSSILACSLFESDADIDQGTRSHSTSTSKSNFSAETDTKVEELEVKSGMRSNVLKINASN